MSQITREIKLTVTAREDHLAQNADIFIDGNKVYHYYHPLKHKTLEHLAVHAVEEFAGEIWSLIREAQNSE